MINQAIATLLQAGLSVIPTRDDKTPAVASWKPFQTAKATAGEFQTWPEAHGLGIVCGPVSGGVFCIDIDLKNDPTKRAALEFAELVREQAPDLPDRLVVEETVNGGFHFVGRSSRPIGNLKLARNKLGKVIIETRGEGGYFCAAPTPGYVLKFGSFAHIPEVTPEELGILLDCAMALSQEEREAPAQHVPRSNLGGVTPLDDYDARTSPEETVALLEAHGWKVVFRRGPAVYLKRPGKKERGISATFNYIPGRLFVFTTSTVFESEHVYKPYAVFAMLEHAGDFHAAAKDLAARGYGRRKPAPTVAASSPTPSDLSRAMRDLYDHGMKAGVSPGWPGLGKLYQVVKGQLNIVTGIPSHGKSEFTDALMINLAQSQGWRFVVYSPENYPTSLHGRKLAEKFIGKNYFGANRMSRDERDHAIEWLTEHFHFLDGVDETLTLDSIFEAVVERKKTSQVDGVIIDPWNELESSRPDKMTETDFIGLCLKRCRMFARKHEIAFWIVAHPFKMKKDPKSGKYPVPTLYDISGSAHWYNKADNGIVVWRDFDLRMTEIQVQKVKFKYYGKVGSVSMTYEANSGRYIETEAADYFRPEHNRQLPPERDL